MTSPTTSADARLPSRESIVSMLLEIAKTAHRAMDDSEDNGEFVRLERDQAQALSDALDALDELLEPPTDTFGPGHYVANYWLTQHAEAGAVAWEKAVYAWASENGMMAHADNIARRVASPHPAQPASQQGEKIKLSDLPMVDESKNGDFPSVETFVSHPTGDKVRGLVEKWRAEAARLLDIASDFEPCNRKDAISRDAHSYKARADELAAALSPPANGENDGR